MTCKCFLASFLGAACAVVLLAVAAVQMGPADNCCGKNCCKKKADCCEKAKP